MGQKNHNLGMLGMLGTSSKNSVNGKGEYRLNYDALNSSTIDKLGEWCLEKRVRPRIKPSRMRRVSMTTL